MKRLLLLLACLPLSAAAQQSEFSIGLGASTSSVSKNSVFTGGSNTVVPAAQASWLTRIGKSAQVGVSVGATSYRRKDHITLIDDNAQPIGTSRASFRFAELAIPIKLEGRHNIHFNKSRLQFGLNVGVVVCTGSKGVSGPYSGTNPWAVPDPVPIGFKNTLAVTGGAMLGYDRAVSKKLRVGISPAVNVVSARFTPSGSALNWDRTNLLDVQLRVNCFYTPVKKGTVAASAKARR